MPSVKNCVAVVSTQALRGLHLGRVAGARARAKARVIAKVGGIAARQRQRRIWMQIWT